jgi:hypothetical protein
MVWLIGVFVGTPKRGLYNKSQDDGFLFQSSQETAPLSGTTTSASLIYSSPVGASSANSHLATSINIFNELQPQASAPIYAKIGLFPARIVTRLSQEIAFHYNQFS